MNQDRDKTLSTQMMEYGNATEGQGGGADFMSQAMSYTMYKIGE